MKGGTVWEGTLTLSLWPQPLCALGTLGKMMRPCEVMVASAVPLSPRERRAPAEGQGVGVGSWGG